MNENEFLAKRQAYKNRMTQLDNAISIEQQKAIHYATEAERISYNLTHVDSIIDELACEFRNNSKLNRTDMQFLFLATGLQCVRWMFQPKVQLKFEKVPQVDRHNAGTDGQKLDFNQAKNYQKESGFEKSRKYPDYNQILTYAVPYDAMEGTEHVYIKGVSDVGKRLSGANHHSATLGHDPLLGYVFGTMNILSRTITYKKGNLETNLVHLHRSADGTLNPKGQYVSPGNITPVGLVQRSVESLSEDVKRLPAALVKQKLHMESDKFTKHGLPVPFISAEKAQELLHNGWNSNELDRLAKHIAKNVGTVSIQATLSLLINAIIDSLYRLVDDGAKPEIKEVKARKIIMYSNTIASTSNVIYTAITRNVNNLDIGGLIVTLYRIANDTKMIDEIRKEFVFGGFEKSLELREFNLLADVEMEV